MAKTILACFKNSELVDFETFGRAAAKRLAPDNVVASNPYISFDEKVKTLIYNPTPTIRTNKQSVCMGICEETDDLFVPDTPLPNGSYALFRVGEDKIEVASDFASSRTIWYYSDDEVFIASTSQRLMTAFLGNLEFNEKACGWFLCSGTLGPGQSWDKRFKMVPPRTRLILNRKTWEVSVEKNADFSFEGNSTTNLDTSEYKKRLEDVVEKAVKRLKINPADWTLALSGGMDSRSLLYYLQDKNLDTVTWGLRRSMDLSTSDARIAKKLAKMCSVKHRYAEMDFKTGSFPTLIDRFLNAGECRIDHLAAYFDCLDVWGQISASGRGVIRGYDAFGRKPPVTTAYQVRRTCNLSMSNYDNAKIPEQFNITTEDIPERLRQKEGESFEDWRDRLWLQHRTPITTAALEDIKLAYVEVINPLLSQEVVRTVQELPVELRTNKKVWEYIVSDMFPGVPFAKRDAIQEVGEVLNLSDVRSYICDSLIKYEDSTLFPKSFLTYLVDNYNKDRVRDGFRKRARIFILAYMPKRIENFIRANVSAGPLSHPFLALRTMMILKMRDILVKDAQTVKHLKKATLI